MLRSVKTAGQRNRFIDRLRGQGDQIGATGRRVAQFIADNREIVLASSAAELGARIGTSDATVVRTVQALGFEGIADLKSAILDSLAVASSPAADMRRTLADLEKSTDDALDAVLRAHADGMKVLSSNTFRGQIASAIHALDAAQRVVVFGIGPSAGLASYVSILLARSGKRSFALNSTGSMLADQLLDLRSGDALLVMAYGRLYSEVATVFDVAVRLKLPTVLMTEAVDTPLAKKADVAVAVPRGRPGNVALHGATLVALESIVLSLAAAKKDDALSSLDRLGELRRSIAARTHFPAPKSLTRASIRRRTT
jgi:DNA-binding MurR/RpiR family transcriptional regulator